MVLFGKNKNTTTNLVKEDSRWLKNPNGDLPTQVLVLTKKWASKLGPPMTRRNFDEIIAEFVSLSKEHVAAFLARKWKREEGSLYEEGDKRPGSIPASMVFHNFDVFKLQNAPVLPSEDDVTMKQAPNKLSSTKSSPPSEPAAQPHYEIPTWIEGWNGLDGEGKKNALNA